MKKKSASTFPFFNPRVLTAHRKQSATLQALIFSVVLVSWCAIALGTNTAQAQSPPPYPKGIWAAAGVDDDLPPELVNNLGIVGVGINEDWNVVNPAPGVYDWTLLDSRVANAKAAGFRYIAYAVFFLK